MMFAKIIALILVFAASYGLYRFAYVVFWLFADWYKKWRETDGKF